MWTAQLSYLAPNLSLEQREEIAGSLDANVLYDEAGGALTLTFQAPGATLRQAADTAMREAGALIPAKPTRITVMSTADFIAEMEHPGALDQVGITEIADMFGVTRQRAAKLAERSDFPAAVSQLRSGPVFSTASVEAFHQRWSKTRNPKGGRPRSAPVPEPEQAGALHASSR